MKLENKKIVSKYKFKRKGIWIHSFEIFRRTKNINYFYSISQVDLDLKMSIMCKPKNFLRILRKKYFVDTWEILESFLFEILFVSYWSFLFFFFYWIMKFYCLEILGVFCERNLCLNGIILILRNYFVRGFFYLKKA